MNKPLMLFLCSGGGGNLRFIHRSIQNGWLSRWIDISVIADRNCPAADYAKQFSFKTKYMDFSDAGQNSLIDAITSLQPDVTITTVHRILRPPVLAACNDQLLNLHYSLLPSFTGTIGAASVKSATDYRVCLLGATVHKVTSVLDGGQPVVQVGLPNRFTDSHEDLMDAVFRAGCLALFTALKHIDSPSSIKQQEAPLLIKNRHALINPSTNMPPALFEEVFWNELRR